MPPRITLEVAVTCVAEATAAKYAGADRLELCSALDVGGVTPSFGLCSHVLDWVRCPVVVLVRPQSGGFVYLHEEMEVMRTDVERCLVYGASAVAVGVVRSERGRTALHHDYCRELADLSGGRAVFHRAFDFLSHLPSALEQLIDLGFQRVLTSGGAPTALDGADVIAGLIEQAAGRIEILPGGGVTPENVVELVRRTGCTQVHGSFRSPVHDPTLAGNPALAAGMGGGMSLDPTKVAAARAALDRYSVGG